MRIKNPTNQDLLKAQPKAKKYTITLGDGLGLLVVPEGGKYWVLRYRYGGRARTITVGSPFPETKIADARVEAFRIRGLIRDDIDPAQQRREKKLEIEDHVANTFGKAANAWHEFRSKAWNKRTADQVRAYLDADILPKLRSRPINDVSAVELGALIAKIENRKAYDIAKKTRQWLKAIFSYARAKGWAESTTDPARDLAAVMQKAPAPENHAHLELAELPAFLEKLDAYKGSTLVKACAKLSLWTANRPGVTRSVRWSELDLDAATWMIPKGREGMKRGYSHVTPLPRQAVAMLREIQKVTGSFEYVFVGRNDPGGPLSDGAVARLLKEIGYHGKQTAHGFRHLISTALNEMEDPTRPGERKYAADWVERQLAHGDPDKIRGTYNKAAYLEPRRQMMQDWADQLEQMANSRATAAH